MNSQHTLPIMDIFYSGHAVERMIERHISPAEIESMIVKPDGIISQSKDKAIYYKRFRARKDNLLAAVAVKRSALGLEILTVMINFEVTR